MASNLGAFGVVKISVSVDAVVIAQCIFALIILIGVFLISVKALTTENTENKSTPKICKITVCANDFVPSYLKTALATYRHL